MSKCKACQEPLEKFFDFGQMPIANRFDDPIEPKKSDYTFHMEIAVCVECSLVQMVSQPDRTLMFHDHYAFHSSTSNFMKSHFNKLAATICTEFCRGRNSKVIEIGCNDGILLEQIVDRGVMALGIEPSDNVAEIARRKGLNVWSNFFDGEIVDRLLDQVGAVDVIVGANVVCHIPNISDLLKSVGKVLSDDGVFIFEDPYIGDVIKKNSFDQIYDEHVFLFSVNSVQSFARAHGLELIDAEPQPTHGGSMRYTLGKLGKHKIRERVYKISAKEIAQGLDRIDVYHAFKQRVDLIGCDLKNLLEELKRSEKVVMGYGATSKSTTLFNYFNIGVDLLHGIFDTTETKIGRVTPGKRIPVMDARLMEQVAPDYLLLLAWNHAEEIFSKEQNFLSSGGGWITYIPSVEVVRDRSL